jgi:AAA ATPase domain
MSNMPPRMLSAPLRLTAMTLRGIGPYLHGARLEIKPLTILCGENGSGKSTWIEVLQAFKEAAESEQFPIAYLPDSVRTGINRVLLNGGERGYQEMQRLSTDALRSARSALFQTTVGEAVTDREFGKHGVVGFEIEVTRDYQIVGVDDDGCDLPNDLTSVPERMLWLGELRSGTKMRLRWSLPQTTWDLAGLNYWIELEVGDGAVLRLRQSFESGRRSDWNRSEDDWIFECSSVFFPDLLPSETDPIQLGTFRATGNSYGARPNMLSKQVDADPDSPVAEPLVEKACANFLVLFRHVCRAMLRGFFPIGALRHILTQESTSTAPVNLDLEYPGDDDDDVGKTEYLEMEREAFDLRRAENYSEQKHVACLTRHVGRDGSMTQEVHAHWAYNLMREPIVPRCGAIDNSFHLEDFRQGVWSSINRLPPEFLTHILSIAPDNVRDAWLQGDSDDARRDELGIRLLNSVITSRTLFARQFRPDAANLDEELAEMLGTTVEEQDERLSSRKVLSNDEVIRVNRLTLESLFNELWKGPAWSEASPQERLWAEALVNERCGKECLHRTGYLFETFVSYWLMRFTETPVKYGDFEGASLDESWGMCDQTNGCFSPPSGGLTDEQRHGRSRGIYADQRPAYSSIEESTDEPYDLYDTIHPPTASGSLPWSAMSTGFHQLAPIVVQAGLLHQHEIMAVENPEVHLHPSLQIEIAEFFVHQANAGKVMLIETHSDLIVRRILRAIRQEDIKQEAVRIYFTHLGQGPENAKWKHALMERLQVNDRGQIENWPTGFMDDDLREADRWLQANFRSAIFEEDSDE